MVYLTTKSTVTTQKTGIKAFLIKAARIISYFRPYWKQWLVLFVIANFYTAVGLVNPIIVKILIDNVLINKDYFLLNFIMAFFIAVALVGGALGTFSRYYYRRLSLNLLFDVRNELFQHLERLDMGFFREKKVGDMLSRLTSDVGGIEEFVSLIFNTLIINVLTVIFIFIVSAYLHLHLTLVAMMVVPGIIIAQRYYGRKIREQYRVIRVKSADFLSFLQEKLSSVPFIKLFTAEDYELGREKGKASELIGLELKRTLTQSLATLFTALLISASLLFILWYGSVEVIRGALSIGSLLAIYAYIGQLFGPVGTLTGLNVALQTTIVSTDRVFEFLDIKPEIVEKKDAKLIPEVKGNIRFAGVSFAYQPGEPVLQNINFEVKAGEKIGLVGPSGVGKTTIAHLLARLYDPTAGSIMIDGEDLRDVKVHSLRKQIGIVRQDITLFNVSIKENIAYANPKATDKEIIEAAKLANIHDFVVSLPRGYETVAAERGMRLSRGERQRISIARVILKNPKILIFDEATASLDTESELKIQEALNRVTKGKTTFIMAHRLSTLQGVDRIFVLSEGKLVEQGTFSGLLAKKGLFYTYYSAQFAGFHAFEQKLDDEIKRAREYKEKMHLLGMRIANLEEIIEKYGEEKSYEELQKICTIIPSVIKDTDISSPDPHQKDLFYVGLLKADELKVSEVSENLRKEIAQKIPLEFTLHFQVAVADVHGQNPAELMRYLKESF